MNFEKDTGGIDKVVDTATRFVNTTDKVVTLFQKSQDTGRKVAGMKTSTKIGLLVGGALALALFPLRLAYDSETGEGEYKSLLVGVKRTQRPERTQNEQTHALSWEMFPTVRVKPSDVKPCELPPAQKRQPVKPVPVEAVRVKKAQPAVPVKLRVQED